MTKFVSLHNQTHYSILDSIISPKDLLKRAKELEYPAVAITDHGSVAAVWEAWKASKDIGIKLIVGCECYFQNDASDVGEKLRHVILIAKNAVGYKNLLTINKKGFDQSSFVGKRVYSVIDWKLLEEYSDGLICLTACGNGIISQLLMKHKPDEAEKTLLRLKSIFGANLGIEVQPNNMKRGSNIFNDEIDQFFLNRQLYNLGKKHSIRVVAACNAHYLTKDKAEEHDVFLAIGARQPVHSNFRLKYTVPEFYLKSGDEVKSFFSRNYGEDAAQEMCDNSIYFADLCEIPEWIDPKFSNSSGKELPVFPVKDEPNYLAFRQWVDNQPENIKSINEDKLYLRYKCFNAFDKLKLTDQYVRDNEQLYLDRINEEIEVLEYQGFSSYMLIVADYLNWCNRKNIPIGPGRGCVAENTQVLTEQGYKCISDIKIGDRVYSHTGALQKVLRIFSFDVDETCLEIKSEMGFETISLTKDHKLYGMRRKIFNTKSGKTYSNWNKCREEPEWIKAEELKSTDLLWMQYPKLENHSTIYNGGMLDLAQFSTFGDIHDEYIEYKANIPHPLSVSALAKSQGFNLATLANAKINSKKQSNKTKEKIFELDKWLMKNYQISFADWQKMEARAVYKIRRFIPMNAEFYYLLGLWVGDGFLIDDKSQSQYKYGIGISSHENEILTIKRIENYLKDIGFSVSYYKKKNEQALQLECRNEIILNMMKHFVNEYKSTSDTKHLPIMFRSLNKENMASLMNGFFDADGNASKNKSENIGTSSLRLALETKEVFLYLNIACSIHKVTMSNKDGANRKQAYSIFFPAYFDSKVQQIDHFYKDNGYYVRISDIKEVSLKKVYDIEVENDHSYLTTNYASHNSVGGCFLGYLLGIHCADSIKYGLIFARFQNKLRTNPPDCDCDVSTKYREDVLMYLKSKYGIDNVCNISNYNTITPKVYVRDVARSLELNGSRENAVIVGDLLASVIPNDNSHTTKINDVIKSSPLLEEYCKKYTDVIKFGAILGKPRSQSMHAAGVIVSQRPLTGLVPLRLDKDHNSVIEYDKDLTEENGFVKMDVLGLSTLDLINKALELIVQSGKDLPVDYNKYDLNDEKTYELISRGDTFGVFQFGTSGGTIELCKKIKPRNLEDLAIITTLARPAAANIRNEFILTREGKKTVVLMHPSLEGAFKKTYGFGLFDESILQLGRDVAGWDLNTADRIRKMIKEKGKNPDKDKKLREEFIASAIKTGINDLIAQRIWDEEIKKFASYTFNKSHAILYSMMSYQTAYLKAHFPIEFLMANLMAEVKSASPDAKGNIDKIKKELRKHHVKILPPDLNKSQLTYTIENGNQLITGLDAIKFVGDEAILDIISKRPFKNFFDFMVRVDSKTVRSNSIQALAACGALDSFGLSRQQIFLYCSDYRKKLQVWLKKHNPQVDQFLYPYPTDPSWTDPQIYALEQNYIGESFICKPATAYGQFFKDEHYTVKDLKRSKDKTHIGSMRGIIKDFFEFKVKKETSKYYGQPMIKAVLEDKNGEQCSVTVFSDRWCKVPERIKEINRKATFDVGLAIHFSGNSNNYEDDMGIILDQLFDVAMPPSMPNDLKAKKINLKTAKSKETKEIKTSQDLLDQIEDSLYDEGLIDLDNDEFDNI